MLWSGGSVKLWTTSILNVKLSRDLDGDILKWSWRHILTSDVWNREKKKNWLMDLRHFQHCRVLHSKSSREKLFIYLFNCTPGIEIWNELPEWLVAHSNTAPEPLREQLREQLLLSNVPTFFHVSEWMCTQNLICVSCACKRATVTSNFNPWYT